MIIRNKFQIQKTIKQKKIIKIPLKKKKMK